MSIQRELHAHLAALSARPDTPDPVPVSATALADALAVSVPPISKTLHNLEVHGKIQLVRGANGRSIVAFRLLELPEPKPDAPASRVDGMVTEELTARSLAQLLSRDILDADDAAAFLGIARNSLEYAAMRSRIAYVQYGSKKLFTRADLLDYQRRRGRGRNSRLGPAPHWVVKS